MAATTILVLASPSPAPARNVVGRYCLDRVEDFCDFFRLRIGIPREYRGFAVQGRATNLAQAGFGVFDGTYVGVDRRAAGMWREKHLEGGVSILYGTVARSRTRGNGFIHPESVWQKADERGVVRNGYSDDDGRGEDVSLGAQAQLPYLPGIDFGFYPMQVVDAVTGLVGIDLMNDDLLYIDMVPATEATESSDTLSINDTSDTHTLSAIDSSSTETLTPIASDTTETSTTTPNALEKPRPYRPNTARP
jgi:hypothetical protein